MSVCGLQEVLQVLHGDGSGAQAAFHFGIVIVRVAEVRQFFENSVGLYFGDPFEDDRLILGGHFDDLRGSVLGDTHLAHLPLEVRELLVLLMHNFLELSGQLVAVFLAELQLLGDVEELALGLCQQRLEVRDVTVQRRDRAVLVEDDLL